MHAYSMEYPEQSQDPGFTTFILISIVKVPRPTIFQHSFEVYSLLIAKGLKGHSFSAENYTKLHHKTEVKCNISFFINCHLYDTQSKIRNKIFSIFSFVFYFFLN